MKLNKIAITLAAAFSVFLMLAPQAHANQIIEELGDLNALLAKDQLQGLVAKEMCSCHYISRLSLEQCEKRSNLPDQLFMFISVDEYARQKTIVVRPKMVTSLYAEARFNSREPRKGCRLIYGRLSYPRDLSP